MFERMWEVMLEVPQKVWLFLRFLIVGWRQTLSALAFVLLFLFAAFTVAVSCADIANLECHKISYQSTAAVDGQNRPVTVTKDVCTDRRDK